MPKSDIDRLQELVLGGADLDPAEVAGYLDRECGGDPDLRAEVSSLLGHLHDDALQFEAPLFGAGFALPGIGELLGSLAPASLHAGLEPIELDLLAPGESFGPYRVVRKLGHGGMGVVYLAEQAEPRRQVALKVMHRGLAGKKSLLRFQLEAQILARFTHPGIARIYDARTAATSAGERPFFVMEYVEGKTLDLWVREEKPARRERLALLIEICAAVEHAHQKGVVHRDLKPGNILVDAEGRPKVLDFGVARALDEKIDLTTSGIAPGTLPYMSPEQIAGDIEGVDTRADVYALGMIAYELLAGRLPFDFERANPAERAWRILHDEPLRLGAQDKSLAGDLETIVSTAIEKEPSRRYPTASALALDVRRFLADEPIVARRASRFYQMRKFAKRHRTLVAGVAAVIVALVFGIVGTTMQAVRAASNAERAERLADKASRVSNFLRSTLVGREEYRRRAPQLEVWSVANDKQIEFQREMLTLVIKDAARRLEESFQYDPDIRAELEQTIGEAYLQIGELDQADVMLTRALGWQRSNLGDEHVGTMRTASRVAELRFRQNRVVEAVEGLRQTRALHGKVLGEEHPDTLRSMTWLALALEELGELDEAEALHLTCRDARTRGLGDRHRDTLTSFSNLAKIQKLRGKSREAEEGFRTVLALQRVVCGSDDLETLTTENNLASVLLESGRVPEAQALLEHTWRAFERTLGSEHNDTIVAWRNLESVRLSRGGRVEAKPVVLPRPDRGEANVTSQGLKVLAAYSLFQKGDYGGAEQNYREVAEVFEDLLGRTNIKTLQVRMNLAAVVEKQDRIEEALEIVGCVLADAGIAGLAETPTLGKLAVLSLGELFRRKQEFANARALTVDGMSSIEAALPPGHVFALSARSNYAKLCEDLGDFEEAEQGHAQLIARSLLALEPKSIYLPSFILGYGSFLARRERFADAEPLLLEAQARYLEQIGAEHPLARKAHKALAELYAKWGRQQTVEDAARTTER